MVFRNWNLFAVEDASDADGLKTDDYAKDGEPGEVWRLCSFCHDPLRTWIETNSYKSAVSSHTILKSGEQALKSYLKIICEFQIHILPN